MLKKGSTFTTTKIKTANVTYETNLDEDEETCDEHDDEIISNCLATCPSVHCDTDLYSFQDRILHHKCAVVKLVRYQMNTVENIINEDIEALQQKFTCYGTIKRWKYFILGLLLLLLFIWLAFIYGTLIGAYICSGKSMKLCKICTVIISITPGLHWTHNSRNVF